MKVQLMTKAAYARHRGCDEKAVRKAIAEGRISLIDGKIDPAVADIQWMQNTRARVNRRSTINPSSEECAQAGRAQPPVSASVDSGYSEARARRERAEADEAEMRTAKMRGAMVMREDVDRAMFEIGRQIRDRLIACSKRVGSEVASLQSAEACEAVIEREHRLVLSLLVDSFREKIGTSGQSAKAEMH
ncbi:MAG: hypothetical protein K2Y15_10655 [Burkholderiaceae bacterium]|nr:hypothetical protein [Burkholderiaceae bacterium]